MPENVTTAGVEAVAPENSNRNQTTFCIGSDLLFPPRILPRSPRLFSTLALSFVLSAANITSRPRPLFHDDSAAQTQDHPYGS